MTTHHQTSVEFRFDFDKAREALVYLAAGRQGGAEKGTLCKLLFLADKFHLVRYGRPITGDHYWAMEHGPIPTRTLDILDEVVADEPRCKEAGTLVADLEIDRRFRYPRLVAARPLDEGFLSQSDTDALDEILSRYGAKQFSELRGLTHEMVAYRNAWDARGDKGSVPMAFEDFFEEDPDAMSGAFEEMVEDAELREAFPRAP